MPLHQLCKGNGRDRGARMRTTAELEQAEIKDALRAFVEEKDRRK